MQNTRFCYATGLIKSATRVACLALAAVLTFQVAAARAQDSPGFFFEGFEAGGSFVDDGVGVLRVRPSGSTVEPDYAHGIPAASGRFYARLTVQPGNNINGDQVGPCRPGAPTTDNGFSCGGPFTEWGLPYGGNDGMFDTGIPIRSGTMTSIEIYVDTAFANGLTGGADYRFDWDSSLLDSTGVFLQDYIFNVGTSGTTFGGGPPACAPSSSNAYFVVSASNNSQRGSANAANPSNNPVCITTSGWYKFKHLFRKDNSGNLEVDMTIRDSNQSLVGSWIMHPICMSQQASEGLCSSGQPLPFSTVGYNFLGWFPDQEIDNLAIDNAFLFRPERDD